MYSKKLWLGVRSYVKLSSYHPVRKLKDNLGTDMTIVIALDGMYSSTVLSLFCLFYFVKSQVDGTPTGGFWLRPRVRGIDKLSRGPHDNGLG